MAAVSTVEHKVNRDQPFEAIKAIIFDFGGVIDIPGDWTGAFTKLGAEKDINMNDEAHKPFIAKYGLGEFNSDADFLRELRKLIGIPENVTDQAIIDAWNTQIFGINEELYKLVDYKGRFKLFALSNTNRLHRDFSENIKYKEYRNRHPHRGLPDNFRDLFDKVYCSHEIHFRKPDVNAWKFILLDNPGLRPEQCLFIDDVSAFTEAAASLGKHTFLFDMKQHSFDDVMKHVAELNDSARLENDLKNLLEFLDQNGLTYKLKGDFNDENRDSHHADEDSFTVTTKERKVQHDKSKLLLAEDQYFKLSFINSLVQPRYFIIEPKKRNQTNDELLLSRVKAFILFLKKMGYMQYCLSQNQGSKAIKILPIPDRGKKVDINLKVLNTIHCFFRDQPLLDLLGISSRTYATPTRDKSNDLLSYPQKSVWINIKLLKQNIFNTILSFLERKGGALLRTKALNFLRSQSNAERSNPDHYVAPKNVIERTMTSHIFCNPAKIRELSIFDPDKFSFGGCSILLNSKPYPGSKAHVLMVPEHTEDWSSLDMTQHMKLQKITDAVCGSMQANYGVTKYAIKSHVNNGTCAGQTVSCAHQHLFIAPEFFPYVSDIGNQLVVRNKPECSKAEKLAIETKMKEDSARAMANVASTLRPEIFQFLLLENSPSRSMLPLDPTLVMFNAFRQQQLSSKAAKRNDGVKQKKKHR